MVAIISHRWAAEFRAHEIEQRRLRRARQYWYKVAADQEELERSSTYWPEAKRVNPDKDE